MNPLSIHPSVRQLAWAQTTSRISRIFDQLRSPRRMALSIAAVLLSMVWIGQAVASIFLREPADPAELVRWVWLSLSAYAAWGAIKVCFRKPVEPFEWTPTESEWLLASPLSRQTVVKFRLVSVVAAATIKSTIFTLVMLPDLTLLPVGFIAMFIGLLLIDAIRLNLEVWVGGLTPKTRNYVKATLAALILGFTGSAMAWTFANSDVMSQLSTAASLGFVMKYLQGLSIQADTLVGLVLTYPFRVLAECIVAKSISLALIGKLVGMAAVVGGAGALMFWLDQTMRRLKVKRERQQFAFHQANAEARSVEWKQHLQAFASKKRSFPSLKGMVPLAWRQFMGAWNYRSSMLVALGVPFVLCCLPAFSDVRGLLLILNVVAGITFYSFLLIPTSLKFDFRRDVDRLTFLKSLPVSPMHLVIGQIAAPVLLTWFFQVLVLIAAMMLNPYPMFAMAISIVAMLPLNILIFGFENLLFMYFPHRINQEGVHVFIRTILAFTAKGVSFAIALGLLVVWMLASKQVGLWLSPTEAQFASACIFGTGLLLGLLVLSSVVVKLLARAFDRFDPSLDLAGLD